MFVGWSAAAQQTQHFRSRIRDLMNVTWRNGDGIPYDHIAEFITNLHSPLPMRDVIDLFRLLVEMGRRTGTRRQPRFGQALLFNARIPMG